MRTPAARIAAFLLLAGAGGGAVWLALRDAGGGQPPVQDSAGAPPAAPPAEPAHVVEAQLPLTQPTTIPEADWIVYPDGTRLPPLNGVTKAKPFVFHRLTPYAKVVGRERDAHGVEWYVHENGLRTTTRLQWRNGVQEAVSEVSLPAAVKPLIDR